MSRYSVDTAELKRAAGACTDISNNINNLTRQIVDVKYTLNSNMGRYGGVTEALNTCITNSSNCKSRVGWYGIYGNSIAKKYEDAEANICGGISSNKFQRVAHGGSSGQFGYPHGGSSGSFSSDPKLGDYLKEFLYGAMGNTGTLLNFVDSFKNKEYAKGFSRLIELVGGVAENTTGSGINWKGFLFDSFKATTDTPWEQALGPYIWKSADTIGKKVSVACNWAASALESIVENVKEYNDGGMSVSRFLSETSVETLLGVGEAIVIHAGVAAVVGGLVTAGVLTGGIAPAVILGGTAVVTMGVDCLGDHFAKKATNGSKTTWKDAIGDAYLYIEKKKMEIEVNTAKIIGETAADVAGDIVECVGDVTKDITGGLCKWGQMVFAG